MVMQRTLGGWGMSSEWQSKRLGDCCLKIGSGATPKGGKDAYLDSGPVQLIRSQNIYNEGFSPSGLAFISEEQAKKLESVSVLAGDVLLNITGDSVARVCQAPAAYLPARVNQHVAIIRVDPKTFDARYLRYFLASPAQQDLMLGLAAAGATRNALTKSMIEAFQVPCPPANVQRGIADILGSLDDRITLLRETNATLEAIAQALFKSWFVDFDPVRAKMEGRTPEGMDEATAALFPDGFETSELGEVPRGWRVAKFEDFVQRLPVGKKFDQKTAKAEGVVPILDQGKSGVIGFHDEDPGVRASLDEPVVVFANHTCYMRLITYDFSAIQNVLPFKGKGIDTVWAYYATKGRVKFSEYKGHWPDFTLEKAVVPSPCLGEAFRSIVDPMMRRVRLNEVQSDSLARLRDTLLPRLISGQLRLPEAQAATEAALGGTLSV